MKLFTVLTSVTAMFLLTSFVMVDTAAAYRTTNSRILSRRSVRAADQNQIEEKRTIGIRPVRTSGKIESEEEVIADPKSVETCTVRQKAFMEVSKHVLEILKNSPRGALMYNNIQTYFDSKKEDCNQHKTKEELETEKKAMEEKAAEEAEAEDVELTPEEKETQNAIRIRCGRLSGNLYNRCASNIQSNAQYR